MVNHLYSTKQYFETLKFIVMKGFATSPSNYTRGLRPRRFLAATSARVKMDIILGKKLKTTPKKAA